MDCSPSSKKMCLITQSINALNEREQCVYIFDPLKKIIDGGDDDGFIPKHPTLRFENLGFVAFCLFGSTLYMFDGKDSDGGKSVHSFDLSPFYTETTSQTQTPLVRKSLLKREADMFGIKHFTEAVVSPCGGEILVFSKVAVLVGHDFEIFDPVGKKSTPLPNPPVKDSNYVILAFGFVSERLFVFVTERNLAFALDLDLQVWQDYKAPCVPLNPSYLVGNPCLLLKNEFAVTLTQLVRKVDGAPMRKIPAPKDFPKWLLKLEEPDMWPVSVSCGTSLLKEEEENSNCFMHCIVRAAMNYYVNSHVYFTLDVWETNLSGYRERRRKRRKVGRKKRGKGIVFTKLNSFGFVDLNEYGNMSIVGLYKF